MKQSIRGFHHHVGRNKVTKALVNRRDRRRAKALTIDNKRGEVRK